LEVVQNVVHKRNCKMLAKQKGLYFWTSGDGNLNISDDTKKGKTIKISRNHAIYAADMINHFGYYFGAVVPENVMGNERPHPHGPAIAEPCRCRNAPPGEGSLAFERMQGP
jgi:hypothetical protein